MRSYLMLTLALMVACKPTPKETTATQTNAKKAEPTTLALYAFDGGTLMINDKNILAQGNTYQGETIELADAFYVIKHPEGILLWDTGLPESLVGQAPYTTPDGSVTSTRKDSIVSQLATIDVRPEEVEYIAFSHIHSDHTGGASHFDSALWLVQQTEVDFMSSDAIQGNSLYDLSSFENLVHQRIIDNRDYDVFQDGTVVIKYFPGHTAGHQALFLNFAQSGPVMLTGDTYHFEQNREDKIVPQINYDIPESLESINQFEDFVKETGAKVYIQHDKDDFQAMTKAPASIK